MTRAMFALAKGHFSEAVRFNALAPLGICDGIRSCFGAGKSQRQDVDRWRGGVRGVRSLPPFCDTMK